VQFGGYGGTKTYATIIGVVGHVENYGLGQDTRVQLYSPYRQMPPANVSFVLRTTLDPAALTSAVRAAMRELEPSLPVFGFRTMDEAFRLSITNQRIMLTILSVLGVLALLLAALGLYGVLSYSVTLRTREFGVRMAVGADTAKIMLLVLSQGLRIAGVGLALGLVLGLIVARLMKSLLYGVPAFDPLSFAAMAAVLVLVGLFASLLPARRATKVDPMTALRVE
jgi:putative ABC transport system permease protein